VRDGEKVAEAAREVSRGRADDRGGRFSPQ